MGKIIRQLLALVWKLLRTVVWTWLKGILGKVALWSVLILGVVMVLAFLFGRC